MGSAAISASVSADANANNYYPQKADADVDANTLSAASADADMNEILKQCGLSADADANTRYISTTYTTRAWLRVQSVRCSQGRSITRVRQSLLPHTSTTIKYITIK